MVKILVCDIETQRAVVETWGLFKQYVPIDRIQTPARILCFAAKWHDEEEVQFEAAWQDGDAAAYAHMIETAWSLLDEADFVVTWNGNRFDLQWFQGEFGRLEMGPPSPYRSLDLFTIAKRKFGRSLMSLKLDWSARQWLGDRKIPHEGPDLWHEIRYGNAKQKLAAQQQMMDYNIQDVVLTDQLLTRYLPWTGENFALYDEDNIDREVCPKCESTNLHKRGFFPTKTYMYQRYRCMDCGSWARGKRMVYSTELRPV